MARTCVSFYPLRWKSAQLLPPFNSSILLFSRQELRKGLNARSLEQLCALLTPLLSARSCLCFLSSLPVTSSRSCKGTNRSFLKLGRGSRALETDSYRSTRVTQHTVIISMCNQPCRTDPSRPFLRSVKMRKFVSGGPQKQLVLN